VGRVIAPPGWRAHARSAQVDLQAEYSKWQKAHPERLSLANGHVRSASARLTLPLRDCSLRAQSAEAAFATWSANYAHVAAFNAQGKNYKVRERQARLAVAPYTRLASSP